MASSPGAAAPIWTVPLYALFDFLSLPDPPRRSDCIVVFAGRPERKRYGIELWKQGFASMLILSVGRFEWRKFSELGLPDDGGMARVAAETPPALRHFLVAIDSDGARALAVDVRGLGTWEEARALAAFLNHEGLRSALVVSSPVHLRRAAMVLKRRARASGITVRPTSVPEGSDTIRREGWWQRPEDRAAVLLEAVKLVLYWIRLRLPW